MTRADTLPLLTGIRSDIEPVGLLGTIDLGEAARHADRLLTLAAGDLVPDAEMGVALVRAAGQLLEAARQHLDRALPASVETRRGGRALPPYPGPVFGRCYMPEPGQRSCCQLQRGHAGAHGNGAGRTWPAFPPAATEGQP